MIHVAVRVREIISSNIDSAVERTSNPHKMLRLLRTEIEESLIGLHGDLSKTRREHERAERAAQKAEKTAEEWTAKAKTAVDHKREDLARAALLAREDGRNQAAALAKEAEALSDAVDEMESAIAQLEGKREDVLTQLKNLPEAPGKNATPRAESDSKTARRMDRIDAIERRVNFSNDGKDEAAPTDVDAEIAALQRDSNIDAELAAMQAPAKKAPSKKPSRKKAK